MYFSHWERKSLNLLYFQTFCKFHLLLSIKMHECLRPWANPQRQSLIIWADYELLCILSFLHFYVSMAAWWRAWLPRQKGSPASILHVRIFARALAQVQEISNSSNPNVQRSMPGRSSRQFLVCLLSSLQQLIGWRLPHRSLIPLSPVNT